MRKRALVGLGVLSLSLALSACGGDASADADPNRTIIMATTPLDEDPTAVNPVAELADLLEAETGREVEVKDVPDYLAVVEAIRNGHADFAMMSGFPSALAVNTGEVDALMAWKGSDDPVSTCIVLEDSPLKSLDDIESDTVVAFADPASSSGYFMPASVLDKAGLKQDEGYKALFSGGHDLSFIALKEKQVDVACTSTMITQMTGSDLFPFEAGETRSIADSEGMPVSMTVLGSQSLDDTTRDQLVEALPAIFAPENAEKLSVLFAAVGDAEAVSEPGKELFQPFVDMAAVVGVDLSDLE